MIETISSENRFGLNSKILSLSAKSEDIPTAVITLSDDYQVRLIASALASALNGVNIITKDTELPDAAFSSLSRLQPDNILVLERNEVIQDSVLKEIKSAVRNGTEPVIIRSVDLSDLSLKAFKHAEEAGATWGEKAFLASFESTYASSAAASYIFETSCPVFFSDNENPLPEETLQALEKKGVDEFVFLDCPGHLASAWNKWAKEHSIASREVLGSNAVEAAFCATEWITRRRDTLPAHLVISPQDNLSYTYSAAPFAADKSSISLVVNHNDLDSMASLVNYIAKYGRNISKATVIGGEYLFSDVDKDIIAKAIAKAKR